MGCELCPVPASNGGERKRRCKWVQNRLARFRDVPTHARAGRACDTSGINASPGSPIRLALSTLFFGMAAASAARAARSRSGGGTVPPIAHTLNAPLWLVSGVGGSGQFELATKREQPREERRKESALQGQHQANRRRVTPDQGRTAHPAIGRSPSAA